MSTPAAADVIIVGAGPAGLSLACALADVGIRALVLERQTRGSLADPTPDGREIALTHRSQDILRTLGIWQRFPVAEVSPISQARVTNGDSRRYLGFDASGSDVGALGHLVANHVIRKAAYEAASARTLVTLLDNTQVARVWADSQAAGVELEDGRHLHAPLVVAADSRFSETRRQMGIGAATRDFGRTVIVCRLAHDGPSDGIAHECFGYGRTLAMLPLNGNRVSAVVTAPSDDAETLLRMAPQAFGTLVQQQFGARLGNLRLLGERHRYPLVAVYADRFVGPRFALVGDAAVGMHPVTAHGFNLGLYGVDSLTRTIRDALEHGVDFGGVDALRRYEVEHRRATWPLYRGTNALVGLFTDDRTPARLARAAALHIARQLPPVQALITQQLTGRHAPPVALRLPRPRFLSRP